ncbi:TolC family protein [Lewinella sp. IMCC34183]|uniref:TolC family protein n=1 Tax=Lewinella sp. IMCC34183 TaxID=2248762 RepID=UPI000E252E6D|nr:TolC family protein [Lewinella sp. IMCC34183]
MKPLLLLLALLLCTCATAQTTSAPGEGEPLTLSDAIQEGLENNYQIRIAANELEVARNNNDFALTEKYPLITLGINPGVGYRRLNNPASVVVQSATTNYTVGPSANVNWVIFNGGRIKVNKERLETLADLSAGQLQLQIENTVQDIINAYYNAVVQREQIDVLARVLTLSRDRIEYQRVRAEYGQGGTFDELQARDAYLTDSISLTQQRVDYRNAVRDLLQVMGSDDLTRNVELTDELTYDPTNYDPTNYDPAILEQRLLVANRNLQNLLINRDLAALQTQLVQTEYAPTVGIGAGVGYDFGVSVGTQTFEFGGDQPGREQELPGIASRTLSGNLGFTASYLLYDGGNRRVREQTARLQEITAQLDYQATQQQLRAALRNTLALYENQARIIGITEDLIANAERNLEIADERFRGGTINSFDYRQIQLNYANAEFQLLNALLNLKNTETELLRVTGQIVR